MGDRGLWSDISGARLRPPEWVSEWLPGGKPNRRPLILKFSSMFDKQKLWDNIDKVIAYNAVRDEEQKVYVEMHHLPNKLRLDKMSLLDDFKNKSKFSTCSTISKFNITSNFSFIWSFSGEVFKYLILRLFFLVWILFAVWHSKNCINAFQKHREFQQI